MFDSNQKTQISRSHRGDEINVLLTVRFKRTVAGQSKELAARRSQGCQKTIIIVSLETDVDFSLALCQKDPSQTLKTSGVDAAMLTLHGRLSLRLAGVNFSFSFVRTDSLVSISRRERQIFGSKA